MARDNLENHFTWDMLVIHERREKNPEFYPLVQFIIEEVPQDYWTRPNYELPDELEEQFTNGQRESIRELLHRWRMVHHASYHRKHASIGSVKQWLTIAHEWRAELQNNRKRLTPVQRITAMGHISVLEDAAAKTTDRIRSQKELAAILEVPDSKPKKENLEPLTMDQLILRKGKDDDPKS